MRAIALLLGRGRGIRGCWLRSADASLSTLMPLKNQSGLRPLAVRGPTICLKSAHERVDVYPVSSYHILEKKIERVSRHFAAKLGTSEYPQVRWSALASRNSGGTLPMHSSMSMLCLCEEGCC